MDRRTARVAAVAVLAILALSAAAATLDTAEPTGTGGGAGGGSTVPLPVDDEGSEGSLLPSNDSETPTPPAGGRSVRTGGLCLSFLNDRLVVLGLLAAVGIGFYALSRRYEFMIALAIAAALFFPAIVLYTGLSSCGGGFTAGRFGIFGAGGQGPIAGGGSGSQPSAGVGQTSPVPAEALVVVVLAAAVLVAVAVIARGTGDDVVDIELPDEPSDADRVAAVGRAAGRAADRVEDEADLENEVYRAWREMTTFLEVPNPDASTPGEFAAAAVDAGMARDDVGELTRLFEAVRYGGAAPTAAREARAVAALRRIETEYADGEGR